MAQNWSNLLYYINNKLAANVNALELTNADIQAIITNITLPEFSAHKPETRLYQLSMATRVTGGLNLETFKLPVSAENFTIVSINDAYYSSQDSNSLLSGVSSGALINPIDIAMSAQSLDIRRSMQPIRTYEFFPPDTISFSQPITSNMILELSIEHSSPNTIQSDLYHKIFKKIALRDVLDNIIATRSKYSTLSTPLGQIELNVDALIQIRDRLNDEIKEAEDNIPPDPMITFL